MSRTTNLRNFKSSKPIMWNDRFINPPVLNIRNLKNKKKITTVGVGSKDEI